MEYLILLAPPSAVNLLLGFNEHQNHSSSVTLFLASRARFAAAPPLQPSVSNEAMHAVQAPAVTLAECAHVTEERSELIPFRTHLKLTL